MNYLDAVKQAREISKKIPFTDSHGDEIVQVQIAAYVDDEERYGTSYYLLWKETYENGKKAWRVETPYETHI